MISYATTGNLGYFGLGGGLFWLEEIGEREIGVLIYSCAVLTIRGHNFPVVKILIVWR